MMTKLLRKPLPQEVLALLEKIDSIDDTSDSSYYRAKSLVRDGHFTRYERALLRNALGKIARRETMRHAMGVVINEPCESDQTIVGGSSSISMGPLTSNIGSVFNTLVSSRQQALYHEEQMRALERAKVQQELQMKAIELEKARIEASPRVTRSVDAQLEDLFRK